METTEPELWQDFLKGEFTVNTSNTIPFTRIGVDQAMVHLSKSTKGQGGISGITSCPKTLLKFCKTARELVRFATETEYLVAVTNTSTTQHHRLSQSTVSCQERAIKQLKTVLAPCILFKGSSETRTIFKLLSKEIIHQCRQDSILSTERVGMEAFNAFVVNRQTCGKHVEQNDKSQAALVECSFQGSETEGWIRSPYIEGHLIPIYKNASYH